MLINVQNGKISFNACQIQKANEFQKKNWSVIVEKKSLNKILKNL